MVQGEMPIQDWVAQMEAAALARLEAVEALQSSLAAARGIGTSRDRSATATVGASGVLLDITFTANAPRLDPAQLRSVVLEAVGRAQVEIAETVAQLTEGLPGAADVRDLVAGRVPEATRDALEQELAGRRSDQQRHA